MLSDLVEVLRCPAGHENGYLVATVGERVGRYIRSGSLACPRCRIKWEIGGFRADFGGRVPAPTASARLPTDASLVRLAAQLDLRTPGGFVLLSGTWSAHAAPLAAAYDVHCVVLNAPPGVAPGEGTSFVDCDVIVPLADATLRGAAVDDALGESDRLMASLVATLRTSARVIAPAAATIPDALQLVAQDEREWVAAMRPAATPPVPLTRVVR